MQTFQPSKGDSEIPPGLGVEPQLEISPEPAGDSQNTTLQRLFRSIQGGCVGEGVYFVLSRLNVFHFSLPAR